MKDRMTGFFIGLLLMADINIHGFLMGIGVTALAIAFMVFIDSWLDVE